ncbi:hypothetical protein J1605_023001 [Eschrichtius robustus]|uniref:Uncharacterized protein n=1 Tax=Eschrichtius robustus TaxID=9764 RepID=A0AB34H755_ESCRO|nr:hypothetical protein J1605_023001 [Eschrichtius robustus]
MSFFCTQEDHSFVERRQLSTKQNKGSTRESTTGTSLMAHWLRICLPMQGTRIRALVQEDPTCRGATKPVSHNY